MTQAPRYLYAETYRTFGREDQWNDHLLLIEQPDGSWRRLTGQELIALHDRYPALFGSSRHLTR